MTITFEQYCKAIENKKLLSDRMYDSVNEFERERAAAAERINNDIAKYFWIKLLTCGMCWSIISIWEHDEWDVTCQKCYAVLEQSDCPDLFY